MKLKLICFLCVLLSSNLLLARSLPGAIAGGVIMGSGAVMMLAAGIVAGVASNEEYCDTNSKLSQKAIIGYHDCSYQRCQYYYCTQGSTTCYDYSGNCVYNSGHCSCTSWQTIAQTCPDYGCKDPNSTNIGPLLHRINEPTYHNSLYAVYAGAGLLGLGLVTLLPSLLVPDSVARAAFNSPES